MNVAVLQFPGSNCDQDVVHVVSNVLGHSARLLWHKEAARNQINEACHKILSNPVIEDYRFEIE